MPSSVITYLQSAYLKSSSSSSSCLYSWHISHFSTLSFISENGNWINCSTKSRVSFSGKVRPFLLRYHRNAKISTLFSLLISSSPSSLLSLSSSSVISSSSFFPLHFLTAKLSFLELCFCPFIEIQLSRCLFCCVFLVSSLVQWIFSLDDFIWWRRWIALYRSQRPPQNPQTLVRQRTPFELC